MKESIRLTQFSHGAGCGCKLAPDVLEDILGSSRSQQVFDGLLVGNHSKDDAAVFDLGNGTASVSTTDFFTPIVDDPHDFGYIAAVNAISDIYAMGARPLMAIAILGWPIDKLSPDIAGQVVAGGRAACDAAGIPLAGGHSIDVPEPIFGLAVTGLVHTEKLMTNASAKADDLLFLTKPLGIGLVTTAEKRGLASEEDRKLARESMMLLNDIAPQLAAISGVHALTDVTGFGLAGHLVELAEGSGLSAEVHMDALPRFPFTDHYIAKGCMPGGTQRNWRSYGHKISEVNAAQRALLADPQTSGGLLVSVAPQARDQVYQLIKAKQMPYEPIGRMTKEHSGPRLVIR